MRGRLQIATTGSTFGHNAAGSNNVGVGDSLGILVEGFLDTEYTDPSVVVPEPASLLLLATGLVGSRVWRERR